MPHEKIREENKRKVIVEATKLFMQQGIEKTTLEMIAGAAGITKRSIQNYFESKNAIILAVYYYHEQLQRQWEEKYINAEAFQKLSGYEQVGNLLQQSMRQALEQGKSVIYMLRLRMHIAQEQMLPFGKMELGTGILSSNLRKSLEKGQRDGTIRSNYLENDEKDMMMVTLAAVFRQFSYYAALEDQEIIDNCRRTAQRMYQVLMQRLQP